MSGYMLWGGFNLFVLVLLAFDLGVLHRKDKEMSLSGALWMSLAYFVLALAFGGGVFVFMGEQKGLEYITGYLIEKSLSVDNIFVFVLVFTHFAVPAALQYRVLFWGILGALAMRAGLILAGAAILNAFHWVIYLFGGFLVVTGIKMLLAADSEPDLSGNRVVRLFRRHLRLTEGYEGGHFVVRKNGLLHATPLLVVLVIIEVSDLIFALDSIPAIFAVSTDPFIVYTSNVFAILGLRALYFALAGVIHRFRYLKYGLSLVLVFIGAKMIVNAAFDAKIISTGVALLVTFGIIAGSMLISVLKTRGAPDGGDEEKAAPPLGWVPGTPSKDEEATGGTGKPPR
ncbi:TerC family protein [Nitratidesulfovibrio termitidis]|uniref:TerC family protein n=1 Tax=Nitratidesulfovibrio termitidis TaxID=42252 RepID=UPI0004092C0D|nr:TerC family protein [Nitratidesulfovibrio termitidis]